jgi:hypothetical protein
MGVVSAYAHPSGRKNAVSWIDTSRNRAYIFGGTGYGASVSSGFLNDLWRYDLNAVAGEGWTWAGGSNATNQVGVYGEAGASWPGARTRAVSWVDASRNRAYIFGGVGYGASGSGGPLNDLWWYDLNAVAGEGWTWAGGSNATNQVGVYGEMGASWPGARYYAVSWVDASKNRAYIFGGVGYGSGSGGPLNDLWWYDLNAEAGEGWTWAGGSSATNQVGVYGEIGASWPGAREGAVSWVDASKNRAYIFGGVGFGASGSKSRLNDLWRYDLNAEAGEGWTWAGGSNATEQVGVYGEMGVESASNMPGARYNAVSWVDASRNRAYIFGGYCYDCYNSSQGPLNDLWYYDLNAAAGEGWTWAGGSNDEGWTRATSSPRPALVNEVGVYGEMGVESASNMPGARHGAVSWVDASRNRAYIFGGLGYAATTSYGTLNDLWYRPAETFDWSLDFALQVSGKLGSLSSSELTDKEIGADVW